MDNGAIQAEREEKRGCGRAHVTSGGPNRHRLNGPGNIAAQRSNMDFDEGRSIRAPYGIRELEWYSFSLPLSLCLSLLHRAPALARDPAWQPSSLCPSRPNKRAHANQEGYFWERRRDPTRPKPPSRSASAVRPSRLTIRRTAAFGYQLGGRGERGGGGKDRGRVQKGLRAAKKSLLKLDPMR